MKPSKEQIKEIEKLVEENPEFVEALIAFGGDMYRRGILAGAIAAMIGIAGGLTIEGICKVYKNHKNKKGA